MSSQGWTTPGWAKPQGAVASIVKAAETWLPGLASSDVDKGDEGTGQGARIKEGRERAFALAGKAILTLVSTRTQARFTFKVTKSEDGKVFFVGVLTGQDNYADYSYLGIIGQDGAFRQTRKSRIGADAPSTKAFAWFWAFTGKGQKTPGVEVWHEGACCRCGRRLTTPESIEAGIGPVCEGRE